MMFEDEPGTLREATREEYAVALRLGIPCPVQANGFSVMQVLGQSTEDGGLSGQIIAQAVYRPGSTAYYVRRNWNPKQ